MLLLTMRECFGNNKSFGLEPPSHTEVRQRGFVTRLSLSAALERIRAYETAFKNRYHTVGNWIEFELLQVNIIDDLDDVDIKLARVVDVELIDRDIEALLLPSTDTQDLKTLGARDADN